MADALLIFSCLFAPTCWLNYMGTGRDRMLFLTRPRTSRVLIALGLPAGVIFLMWLGFPSSWAFALALSGPAGAAVGNWAAGDGPIILRFRLFGR